MVKHLPRVQNQSTTKKNLYTQLEFTLMGSMAAESESQNPDWEAIHPSIYSIKVYQVPNCVPGLCEVLWAQT